MSCSHSRSVAEMMAAKEAYSEVLKFFDYDSEKTKVWFETPNPMLGGIIPEDMIKIGRAMKLLKIVRQMLSENER